MNDVTEQIANNFYRWAISLAPNPVEKDIIPEVLKDLYVVWDGETVGELATGTRVSEHNKDEKLEKFDHFKNEFLNGQVLNKPILVVKDSNHDALLIIDGIHRSVGYYKAYLQDESILSKIKFRYLLFESDRIHEMDDYGRLLSLIVR